MGKWIGAAAVFVTLSSQAAPQAALVSAGRCDDAELMAQFKAFSNGLRARMGERLLEEAQLMKHLSLLPSRGSEELERHMDAAELNYYEAKYDVAEQQVRDALSEVDRTSAGSSRWKLVVRGELLQAMILRATSRSDEADEHFRRVLRLTPSFRLDPDYFPPSTRARFDRVRRQVESEPSVPLVVTSTPSGADVFIDGLGMMDKTPLSLELPAGRYSVSASKGGAVSFPRKVDLTSPLALHVDLPFEGALQSTAMPCIADDGDEPFRLASGVKLGTWLDVEQVVIARAEPRSAGYTWVSAAIVQVSTAQKIREGGLKVDPLLTPAESLGELADFISTGKAGRNIVASDSVPLALPKEPIADSPAANGLEKPSVRDHLGAEPGGDRPSADRWKKPLGAGLIGLATLAVGAGVVFHLRSDESWAELYRHYPNGRPPALDELETVRSIHTRADSQRRSEILCYALGAAALTGGTLLILTRAPAQDFRPTVSVRAFPGALSITGSWR